MVETNVEPVAPALLGSDLAAPNMSNYREKLIEHVFIAELLQECAFDAAMLSRCSTRRWMTEGMTSSSRPMGSSATSN